MADPTGRPNDYDDVLTLMHNGAWFGFYKDADYSTGRAAPHVYENLVIHDGSKDKPTKDYLDTELAKLQTAWDGKAYARNRYIEYPAIEDQLDMMYHDQVDGTTTFKDAIKAVKDKYPKSQLMTEDIKVQDEDIQELLKQFPAVQKELTIIAQRRIIRELEEANQNLIKQKANIKEVKVS